MNHVAPDAVSSHPSLRVTYVSPGRCVFAQFHNVALQIWLDQATAADALALRDCQRAMQSEYPGGISTLHWLRNLAAMPTLEARQHFAAMMDEGAAWFGEVAILMDGEGFWAGAVRAMLTGLRLTVGRKAGFRTFRDMDEATTWLTIEHASRTRQAVDGAEVARCLKTLWAQHGTPPTEAPSDTPSHP